MAEYYLSKKAVNDLEEIWNYTFDYWSEAQADKYYQMLLNVFKEIANNPKLGRNYDIISENLLGFRANRHLIFYRIISQDSIKIIRILHEKMDLKERISE